MNNVNFCERIFSAATLHPERLALRVPDFMAAAGHHEDLHYGQLLEAVAQRQSALQKAALQKGDRVLLFMAPGIPLYVTLIALLALGMVPVLLERGMSRSQLRTTLALTGARAVIGDIRVMRYWWLFPALWKMQRFTLAGMFPGIRNLSALADTTATQPHCLPLQEDDHGLITYTSGSTGLPKGADRTHGSLIAQHLAIRAHWPDADDDVDLPVFPVLVLHNLCCGISTILPDTDLAFPGRAAANRIIDQIINQNVTRVAGSPAYMERLTRQAQSSHITATHVRSVIIGGSTLTRPLAERCRSVFPCATIRVVYGSTEAEPISDIDIDTLLSDWHLNAGHLVGHPADMAKVMLARAGMPLTNEKEVLAACVRQGEEGEILVTGPHVLKSYIDNPVATHETKIGRSDGSVWHRTGDTGFLDAHGRLWLTGRLKDRVNVNGTGISPFVPEKFVDALPGVQRSALIEDHLGPVLVIQGQHIAPADLSSALSILHLSTIRVAYIPEIPVDIRHNSKIDRPCLRTLLNSGKLAAQLQPLKETA